MSQKTPIGDVSVSAAAALATSGTVFGIVIVIDASLTISVNLVALAGPGVATGGREAGGRVSLTVGGRALPTCPQASAAGAAALATFGVVVGSVGGGGGGGASLIVSVDSVSVASSGGANDAGRRGGGEVLFVGGVPTINLSAG
jgi:hypothetical protein